MQTNGVNINEAIDVKLTLEILDSMNPTEVIYAETAFDGAMGNSGELIIYILKENQLICYSTDIISDKVTHSKASIFLSDHVNDYFNLFYGGYGNYVLINKATKLVKRGLYFAYQYKSIEYKIYSSVRGVFLKVADELNNLTKESL